jgi:hypothetical protein
MRLVWIAILLCSVAAPAQEWGPVQFLVGHWTGEGKTADHPGGAGAFSFSPDVQGKVLLRRNFAEYPAENGKPAYRHDDLMAIYHDPSSHDLRAIYFDNEDHVIEYSIHAIDGGVVFVSDGAQGGPRFRLTYTSAGQDRVTIKFEVAAPGKDFAPYIEATAHRDSAEK